MAVSEVLLWDAADKNTRIAPRLRRTAVAAGCLGLFGLLLWGESDVRWAVCAPAAYVLVEIAHWVWDRRRLVEARIVAGEAGGRDRLRLRSAGGRTTEHDPHQVVRVLVIRSNVDDSAKLRLRLRRKRLFFGRPGRPPVLTTWRKTCPGADVNARKARWGMPGVPD
ncbi:MULTISPECIES: hypothetical protein [unclassified Streptomyces]|uniref:hypothetical protein n=1 Tax=unclassified Streptomyces TaxID=2593676 RepID=UPI0007ECC17A|nr:MULTISPECIES: hypothetical protein [unclassified Streptomyces]MCP3765783.1 hypothetical protein [Streptomyces sp. MAR25Y5]OBQ47921.1 hypothetical protein A4U61_21955 [Streptomyces sp. H-KF8]